MNIGQQINSTRKKSFILLTLLLSVCIIVFANDNKPGSFTAGNQTFLLNGKPFVIRAAELHYSRIPKEYWEHRIKMCKAMGMNTICIYLFWNFHEQQKDQFDFKGDKDVAAFVKLVQQNGMYCIVRPGPYVCAEWDMGGLPWWLLQKKDLQVRTLADPYFIERTNIFLKMAAKELAPLQIQNGGNIIMVQVENEYASFGNDGAYMKAIRDGVRNAGFDKVQLFRCDWSSNFTKYALDSVCTTLNFGAGSDVDEQFKKFKTVYPTAPLMCSEYWTGWFDNWGRPHETRSIGSFIGSLKDMMDRKISFSLYMAHGGTSFGQWGGANSPGYAPMATSYDYNAPIDEQGNATDKFFAVRQLLKNYLQEGETLPEVPKPIKVIGIPAFEFTQTASLFDNLPMAKQSIGIQPMEAFNQGWGRILYRTQLPASDVKTILRITELHDWASVFINKKFIGKLDRKRGDNELTLPILDSPAQLDILVEATGRINYGKAIIDRKGITEKVEVVNGKDTTNLSGWSIYNFPVDAKFQQQRKYTLNKVSGPAWYKANFSIDSIGDSFLDVSSWGKGMVWVNGHSIGRFWKIGPQQTLYVPGVWLKSKNEVIVLDLDGPSATTITGLKTPILDQLHPDESLLHRNKRELLNLSGERAVYSGSLKKSNEWKTITFDSVMHGRYFCLDALEGQDSKDPIAAIAEIEMLDANGNPIPSQNWKIIYADSEEITAANNSADKIFDQQESTAWQTQSTGSKPAYPHQVIIDLGQQVLMKGFRILPRPDKNNKGMIKDYEIYLKDRIFNL